MALEAVCLRLYRTATIVEISLPALAAPTSLLGVSEPKNFYTHGECEEQSPNVLTGYLPENPSEVYEGSVEVEAQHAAEPLAV